MESFMFVLIMCGGYGGSCTSVGYFRTLPSCEYALQRAVEIQNRSVIGHNAPRSFCSPLGGGVKGKPTRHV